MKKILLGSVVFLLAMSVFAGMSTNVINATNKVQKLGVNLAFPAAKAVINANVTNTAIWQVQYGATTNNGVITFTKAFSAAPAVFVSWDGVLSDNAQLVTNAIKIYAHATGFTNTCPTLVATHQWWMAVGPCTP